MAAIYRKVSTRIWNDRDFLKLSDDGKLLFLFLLTHPHMTSIGGIRGTIEGFSAEIGWPLKRLSKGFQEGLRKPFFKYDEAAHLVILPKFLRHNPPENPNVVKGYQKAFEMLPESELLYEQYQNIKNFIETLPEPFQKGFERVCPPTHCDTNKPFRKQEQEQEQEQDNNVSLTPEPDAKPTAEVVLTFPTVEKGTVFECTKKYFDKLVDLYPGVDVMTELRKALAWVDANAKNRKTPDGMKRYIVNWLNRAQNQSRPGKAGNGTPKTSQAASAYWVEVLNEIRRVGSGGSPHFSNPEIYNAVTILGGWGEICRTPEKYLGAKRNQFINIIDDRKGEA